mmetsp:Transcript_1037/g.3047  ORF Transcript_1037/g.3047 Transcript_1037/m.3047 type:complete len:231 (+) Transcript_1037:1043-1735(+)
MASSSFGSALGFTLIDLPLRTLVSICSSSSSWDCSSSSRSPSFSMLALSPLETVRWWLHRMATSRLAPSYTSFCSVEVTAASISSTRRRSCCSRVTDALYVRNTLALRPGMSEDRCLLSMSTVSSSNTSAVLSLPLLKRCKFFSTCIPTSPYTPRSTTWWWRIESLPRKSSSMLWSSGNLMCSTRREQQPTVSASSSSFSLPTRRASLSITHIAVASWATDASRSYRLRT